MDAGGLQSRTPPLNVNAERVDVTHPLKLQGAHCPPTELVKNDGRLSVVPIPEPIVAVKVIGTLFMTAEGFPGI